MSPEREARMHEVLDTRQPDLLVVLEDITDPHNISAVLRSCDAVGVAEVHLVGTYSPYGRHLGSHSSASAFKWVDVHTYGDARSCMAAVRKRVPTALAATPGEGASGLFELDFCRPLALIFGNERRGISPVMQSLCDGSFRIPQVGMVPSLNISVACAVSLYEAFRQRSTQGYYQQVRLPAEQRESLFRRWESREFYRRGKR
jgi:tRNA (guanosine-2'-O-)-methyltransferase